MLEITTTSPEALWVLTDFIHDFWFDVEEVSLCANTLEIPFKRTTLDPQKGKADLVDSVLTIHHVVTYTLEDTQKIGRYDFNELRADQDRRMLTITTGIPMKFEVEVETVEVSLTIPC